MYAYVLGYDGDMNKGQLMVDEICLHDMVVDVRYGVERQWIQMCGARNLDNDYHMHLYMVLQLSHIHVHEHAMQIVCWRGKGGEK